MNDFYEILDYCAFDVGEASDIAKKCCAEEVIKEVLGEVGLDRLEPKSSRTTCRRLRCSGRCESSWC